MTLSSPIKICLFATALFTAPVVLSHAPIFSHSFTAYATEAKDERHVAMLTPRVARQFEPILETVRENEIRSADDFEHTLSYIDSLNYERWNSTEQAQYWRYKGVIELLLEEREAAHVSFDKALELRLHLREEDEQFVRMLKAQFPAAS